MELSLGGGTVSREQTPDGRRIVVRRAVDAPADAVWEILTDTAQWPEWGPSITAVESEHRYVEAGTSGRVKVAGAVWLPFEVQTCRNDRWTWDVARIPATGHFVERGETTVGFEIPTVAAGYAPVCARACRRIATLAERKDSREG